MNRIYPAKLLLFGEYTIINNSEALAIPFGFYRGSWEFFKNDDKKLQNSNKILKEILKYLKNEPIQSFDLFSFENDVENGLSFSSNIPYGYGLGSSGALTAAIYDKYHLKKTEDLIALKAILAKVECFFHGKSSGIDPIVSFLNKSIKIESNQTISILPEFKIENYAGIKMYVVDCGYSRQSNNLVNTYMEYCKDADFINNYTEPLTELTSICIKSFIEKDISLSNYVTILSEKQFMYMKKMIPEQMLNLWELGLKSGNYSIKLCGAGGGGFLLAFCYDENYFLNAFQNYKTYKVID